MACTLQIVFTPTAGGSRNGTLTVADNAANSPQMLSLTGAGVDFNLNPNGGTSLTITNGQNAVYPLLLSSPANVSGTVSFTCSGAPANATCTVTPSTVTLGVTTTVSVTVLTGVAAASSNGQSLLRRSEIACLAILMPLGCGLYGEGICVAFLLAFLCWLSGGCDRMRCGANDSAGERLESEPYANSCNTGWHIYDRCYGDERRADADGQPYTDCSVDYA